MERWEEGFHRKGKTYQQNVFSRCIQGRLKLHQCHVALKSHNTCTNHLASSIVFGCLSPSFCTGSSEQNIKEKLIVYLVWLSALCFLQS